MKNFFMKFLFFLVCIGLIVSIGFNAYLFYQNFNNQNQIEEVQKEKENLEKQIENLSQSSEDNNACIEKSDDNRIFVVNPCANQVVTENIKLMGVAFGLFENNMVYTIETENSEILYQDSYTYTAPDLGIPGEFEIEFNWEPEGNEEVQLHVFEISARDGSRIHEVVIPLTVE